MSKRLSKCIASFNYFDKSLLVLSATSGSISLELFATVIWAPVRIVRASFRFTSLLPTGIIKKFVKIVMLARSKLNSVESKISESLMNN